jgi:isochorismate hydrolase
MITFGDDVPEWVRTRSAQFERFFGVQAWKVHLVLYDKPGNDETNSGVTYLRIPYRQAQIQLTRALVKPEETKEERQTLFHEWWHIALAAYHEAFRHVVEIYVPEGQRTAVWSLFEGAEEATIELLCRAQDSEALDYGSLGMGSV